MYIYVYKCVCIYIYIYIYIYMQFYQTAYDDNYKKQFIIKRMQKGLSGMWYIYVFSQEELTVYKFLLYH